MINRDGKIRVYSPKRCWTDLTYAEENYLLERYLEKKRDEKEVK